MSSSATFPVISETTLSMLGLSGVFCVLVPLVAAVIGIWKLKKTLMPLLYGIALYFFTQMLLVTPIGNLLLSVTGLAEGYVNGSLTASVMLSVAAGLVEELARFVCLAYLMKRYREWKDGVMFGVGYGISSMLVIGGLSSFNDLITAAAISSGAVEELDSAAQQSFIAAGELIASNPAIAYLMAGVDQTCIALMSVALAVLLLEGVRTDKLRILGVTMFTRCMALVCPLLFSALWSWGFFMGSAFLALIAVVSVWYLMKTKESDPSKPNFKPI